MTKSNKILNDELRLNYLDLVRKFFIEKGEDVLTTGSNEICIPCLDSEKNDKWVQIIVKVPTGSRDGEDFDGYGLEEDYKNKQKEKAEKEKERKIAKEKKIARDKKEREEKARLREERKKEK